jgi:hypothetical protein
LAGWLAISTSRLGSDDSVAAGAGELLRDNLGAWLQGISMNGGFCALVKAELWAVVTGLE